MLLVANAKVSENKNNKFKIPAVTHVDKSARIQTVKRKDNKIFYELIKEFFRQTKCPILVNTSFNIRGEPIVCSPRDAYKCFMGTNLDVLVMESFFIDKKNNKSYKTHDYKDKFALD
jgi:carbamoyltransferase